MSVREIFTNNEYDLTCHNLEVVGDLTVDGNLGIIGTIQMDTLFISDTTNSTSETTGAFVVAGGMGIGKDLNVGGTLTATNIVYKSTEIITSTGESTSPSTGALITEGGLGVYKSLNVGTYGKIWNNTASTSTSTGAFNVVGGAGIGGNLNVGGSITGSYITPTTDSTSTSAGGFVVAGGLSVAKSIYASKLTLTGANISTSITTGDLVVSGGIGCSNNLYVSGNSSIGGSTTLHSVVVNSAMASTSTDSGALTIAGGTGIAGDLYVGGTIHGAGGGSFNPANIINLTNTTDSTNSITGALTTDGGLGVVKNANFGGIINVLNTTQATDTTTGSLLVSGGSSIQKDLYIGGNLFVNGTTNISARDINTTNWLLLNVLTTSQNLNVLARTGANNMTQLLINAGQYSTNLENFSINNMPRFIVYNDGQGNLNVFIQSPSADTTVQALLNDTQLTYIDYGSATYPTGYTGNYVFDTSNNAGFSSSDVFYLYNTTESASSSTGALIVQGGVGCLGLYTGSDGLTTSNGIGGYSQIYTDTSGNMNLTSSNSGLIITSSNLQMKYQRIDDLNVSKLNNAPIYCYGAISSLKKVGCVEGLWVNPCIYGTTSTSNSCYGGLSVNQGTQSLEISNVNGGTNIRNVPNYTFFLSGIQYTNTDYTNNNISISSSASTSGSLSIVNGYILMNTDGLTTTTLKYPTGNSVDGGQTGSMSCYFITNANYTNPPTNTVLIMQLFGSSANGSNKIQLYHFTSGYLKLQCIDQNGTQICDTQLVPFTPVAGTPYFISVDWDFTAGNTQVFLNGSQIGSTITTTGTRTFSINMISSCPSTASYSWGFVQIYTTKQYTTTYTPPVKTNYNLLTIPSTGGVQIFNNNTDTISGTITCGNDGSLYWNGTNLPGQFIPSQVIQITNTTNSSSGSTGALQVAGGFSVVKDVYLASTTVSTSASSGSLIVCGGLATKKPCSFGDYVQIYNNAGTGAGAILNNDGSGNLDLNVGSGVNIATVASYEWYASLSTSLTANYSENGSSLSATTTGSVSISGGKLLMSASASTCYWLTGGLGVDGTSSGCVNFKFTPLYTGSPSASIILFQLVNQTGNANRIQLYNTTSGTIKLSFYDNSATQIFDTTVYTWAQVNGIEYEFELDWSPSATRLFINGTQVGSTITTSIAGRTGTCARINLGNGGGGSCAWRQIQLYTDPQHTGNYTPIGVAGTIVSFNSNGVNITNNLVVGGTITGSGFPTYSTTTNAVTFTGPATMSGTLSCSLVGNVATICFPFDYVNFVTGAYFSAPAGSIPAGYRVGRVVQEFPIIIMNGQMTSGILAIFASGAIDVTTLQYGNFTSNCGFGFAVSYIVGF